MATGCQLHESAAPRDSDTQYSLSYIHQHLAVPEEVEARSRRAEVVAELPR